MPLKKLLRVFWIAMFGIEIVLYTFTQAYVMSRVTQNVEKSIQGNLYVCQYGIEDTLRMVDEYIFENYYANSSDGIAKLCHNLLFSEDPMERISAESALSERMKGITSWSDKVAFDMLYVSGGTQPIWFESGEFDDYGVRMAIKAYFAAEDDKLWSGMRRYFIFFCNGKKHILRAMRLENCYFILGVSESAIMESLESAAYGENSIFFAADETGEIIFSSQSMPENVVFENEGKYIHIAGGSYLQTGHISPQTGYYFGTLTPKESIQGELRSIKAIFFAVLLLLSVLAFLTFAFVKRHFEWPVRKITAAMKEAEDGALEIDVQNTSMIAELHQLVDSFNHMIGRIHQLKIEKYEAQLEGQKATMQYLQMQIKPHFYANVLNIIYSLAETKNYSMIQKISTAIVNYSRYMFRDATELVELRRELEHVANYMEIQKIRYQTQVICEENIPENLKGALVPPFVIQSFVENSIKYAFSSKKSCTIRIEVSLDADCDDLLICVRDNGQGFREELLGGGWKQTREDGHIGLGNVYTRLRLIYEDKADITLRNDGGAVACIRIPYIAVDDADMEL